jgi:4-diphosphocytidyl-2-C-methyl-D-erythritol kinase
MKQLLHLPAPAKINWFLHVTGRRTDGYHELQTLFQCISLSDSIDLHLRSDARIERPQGMVGVAPEHDLGVRAARLLQQHTGCPLGVEIFVSKHIPAGAGLGGGSSDAATILLGLNRLWNLGLKRSQLQTVGLQLGADVPFFIFGHTAFAEGVGEELQPIQVPEQALWLLDPGVSVPTASVFQAPELTRNTPPITIRSFREAVQRGSLQALLEATRNDLQDVAAQRFEKVRQALLWLHSQPQCRYVRMTGSGACCFALVEPAAPPPADIPSGMRLWQVNTLRQHPLAEW